MFCQNNICFIIFKILGITISAKIDLLIIWIYWEITSVLYTFVQYFCENLIYGLSRTYLPSMTASSLGLVAWLSGSHSIRKFLLIALICISKVDISS